MQRERRRVGRCQCGTSLDIDVRGEDGQCNECVRQRYEEVWSQRISPEFTQFKALLYGCLMLLITLPAYASEINPAKLCDAIYKTEGGSKTKHPYGILKKYKTATPRQACLNTVASNMRRYEASAKDKTFIAFMGASYAPLNAKNDPSGLNKNWVRNVEAIYGSL